MFEVVKNEMVVDMVRTTLLVADRIEMTKECINEFYEMHIRLNSNCTSSYLYSNIKSNMKKAKALDEYFTAVNNTEEGTTTEKHKYAIWVKPIIKCDLNYWLDRLQVIEAENEEIAKGHWIKKHMTWVSNDEIPYIEVIPVDSKYSDWVISGIIKVRELKTGEWK